MKNLDTKTVESFGREWKKFDQSRLGPEELRDLFDEYFRIFPWHEISQDAVGVDVGCGSGRWATLVAPKVRLLHCVDPSYEALEVARRKLSDHANCRFHQASLDQLPLDDSSMDFGYCLGVLHHVPDTHSGLESCVRKLKPGAPFLIYLYYAFDNKTAVYRMIWRASEVLRSGISRLPWRLKVATTSLIAALAYWPLARCSAILERIGFEVRDVPLAFYRHLSFYTMRTDALDRFGTPLEQRFTARQVKEMMTEAGLDRIRFSDRPPYWCAVGFRAIHQGSGLPSATDHQPAGDGNGSRDDESFRSFA